MEQLHELLTDLPSQNWDLANFLSRDASFLLNTLPILLTGWGVWKVFSSDVSSEEELEDRPQEVDLQEDNNSLEESLQSIYDLIEENRSLLEVNKKTLSLLAENQISYEDVIKKVESLQERIDSLQSRVDGVVFDVPVVTGGSSKKTPAPRWTGNLCASSTENLGGYAKLH